MMRISKFFKRFFLKSEYNDSSININDHQFIYRIVNKPDFPWLISFPRTGSHWLRMMMELYFEKPSLVEIYYYKEAKEFTCYHRHDMDLNIYRKNVIYLYRDPIPTIFSKMMYEEENIHDSKRIKYWASIYGKHLCKWLTEERMSEKKTILRYENMRRDLLKEFAKLTNHFGMKIDPGKLKDISKMITKNRVKKKTTHDQKVVNLSKQYSEKREEFAESNTDLILSSLLDINRKLSKYFNG